MGLREYYALDKRESRELQKVPAELREIATDFISPDEFLNWMVHENIDMKSRAKDVRHHIQIAIARGGRR